MKDRVNGLAGLVYFRTSFSTLDWRIVKAHKISIWTDPPGLVSLDWLSTKQKFSVLLVMDISTS